MDVLAVRWPRRLAALAMCSLVLVGCSGTKERYGSPDGRREVVIERDQWVIDTVWVVTIRGATGLFGNEREVGCFTDDDPESGTPTGVTWTSADDFAIATTADAGDVRVSINPDGSTLAIEQPGDDLLTPCPVN